MKRYRRIIRPNNTSTTCRTKTRSITCLLVITTYLNRSGAALVSPLAQQKQSFSTTSSRWAVSIDEETTVERNGKVVRPNVRAPRPSSLYEKLDTSSIVSEPIVVETNVNHSHSFETTSDDLFMQEAALAVDGEPGELLLDEEQQVDNEPIDKPTVVDGDRLSVETSVDDDNDDTNDVPILELDDDDKKETAAPTQPFIVDNDDDDIPVTRETPRTTMRSLWKRRHARSIQEGIRREKTTSTNKLSLLLHKKKYAQHKAHFRYAASTLMGLLNGLAQEAEGLHVDVDARQDTPLWNKHVESIRIDFVRLAFKPLRLGGLFDDVEDVNDDDDKVGVAPHVLPKKTEEETPNVEGLSASADETFDRIDADNSGALDRDEIAMALNLAAASPTDSDAKTLQGLASQLVELYDANGDGVVDRDEYQAMVEDMAELRRIQRERRQSALDKQDKDVSTTVERPKEKKKWRVALEKAIYSAFGRFIDKDLETEIKDLESEIGDAYVEEVDMLKVEKKDVDLPIVPEDDSLPKGSGTIILSDLKLDLRRLLFGGIPLIKKITPGGPLILEPFNLTVVGSFNREDVMNSFLIDEAFKRLVGRVLRRRVRSFRDLVDGALFYGRDWNMASKKAPVVEVSRLTNIEFDKKDRMIITGRAKVRTSSGAPTIENAFKIRTKIGTRKDGHTIRLVQPELALVLECPSGWERNIVALCKKFDMPVPERPEPLYSFFPVYSPFQIEDKDGFYMGEDNCFKNIYVKDGALRFEMSSVLRPGRFLGSHYLAFSVPNRNFIITMDKVKDGIRAARRNKKEAKAANTLKRKKSAKAYRDAQARSISSHDELRLKKEDLQFAPPKPQNANHNNGRPKKSLRSKKSFFSRFVEGYIGVSKVNKDRNERLTLAISDWFGRQGLDGDANAENDDGKTTDER